MAKVEELVQVAIVSKPSVVVLQGPQLYTVYVGACKESCWKESTTTQRSSTGRSYDPVLFCKCDRMVWAVGMTDSDHARKMEIWGMEAARQVFNWSPQRDHSSVEDKHIGPNKQNCCYFMPVYMK